MRCELDHMSLERPKQYIALSYAWGDIYDKVVIELNRGIFAVTKSLYDALVAVRETTKNILVWADAVCINQKDVDERSDQIQMMNLIYKEAETVGIWLGPEADNSDLAITLINLLTEEGQARQEIKRMINASFWETHFDALVDLFERDYWRRLWVVQEVNNAEQGMVYCGDSRTPWDRFLRVSDVLSEFEEDLQRCYPGATRLERISYWSFLTEHGPRGLIYPFEPSFEYQLGYFRSKLSADPRDKLYGLLGVLPSQIRKDFKPDYTSSVEKLYIDIVEYFLQTAGSLNIICEAHRLTPSSLKLPSWVPDWSQSRNYIPLGKNSASWRGSEFHASGAVEGDVRLLGDTRSKLRVKAIYIGTVKRTGIPLSNVLDQRTTLTALIDWWDIFKQVPGKDVESFCRIITLDQIKDKRWTSLCCHVIAMLAKDDIPRFRPHRDLRISPSGPVKRHDAEMILERELKHRLEDQRLFVTERNDLGLARGTFDPDCVVCIPLGCNTPVILQPDGNDGEYIFHGDAYVDGFMYGEAAKDGTQLRTHTLH